MDSLIGDFFLKNGQSKAQHIEAITGDSKLKAILLYFGGSWAPPCKLHFILRCVILTNSQGFLLNCEQGREAGRVCVRIL